MALNWRDAINLAIADGQRIRRRMWAWPDNVFIEPKMVCSRCPLPVAPGWVRQIGNRLVTNWSPTEDDLIAPDWEVVDMERLCATNNAYLNR